eukprot:4244839-Pleurochrysis_carterae.AAC.2
MPPVTSSRRENQCLEALCLSVFPWPACLVFASLAELTRPCRPVSHPSYLVITKHSNPALLRPLCPRSTSSEHAQSLYEPRAPRVVSQALPEYLTPPPAAFPSASWIASPAMICTCGSSPRRADLLIAGYKKDLDFAGRQHSVYIKSHLGYGLNEVDTHALQATLILQRASPRTVLRLQPAPAPRATL